MTVQREEDQKRTPPHHQDQAATLTKPEASKTNQSASQASGAERLLSVPLLPQPLRSFHPSRAAAATAAQTLTAVLRVSPPTGAPVVVSTAAAAAAAEAIGSRDPSSHDGGLG